MAVLFHAVSYHPDINLILPSKINFNLSVRIIYFTPHFFKHGACKKNPQMPDQWF